MPRKPLIKTSEFPYHVYNRSNNKEFFYIPLEPLWNIFVEVLFQLTKQFNCEIIAFVLMSNHYHLVISTPDANIGDAMKYLHREVARRANRAAMRTNHLFGGRYKWSVIGTELYYWNAVKYIFRNPVKASICSKVTDYRFSSLNRVEPLLSWKMVDHFFDRTRNIHLDLDWLEEPFSNEQDEAIGRALRRREFALPRSSIGRVVLDAMHIKKGTVT